MKKAHKSILEKCPHCELTLANYLKLLSFFVFQKSILHVCIYRKKKQHNCSCSQKCTLVYAYLCYMSQLFKTSHETVYPLPHSRSLEFLHLRYFPFENIACLHIGKKQTNKKLQFISSPLCINLYMYRVLPYPAICKQ